MLKNQEIVLDITDVTAEGSGVGKYDGMAVFVPLTAVGDRARVKLLKVKKSYAYGKLLELLKPAECRIEPDCPIFNRCGGCAYRHIDYNAELEIKYNKVYETVKRIGGVDLKPQPILSDRQNRYRNKAQLPVSLEGRAGFFAFHSHRIIPLCDCLLQPECFKDIISLIEVWIEKNQISIYDEALHKGLLRHIYLRMAEATNEIMLTLVINGQDLPQSEDLVKKLTENFPIIKSIQININTEDTNVILGDKCKTVFGSDYITDILCGLKVRLSALSFYQVNRNMAKKLYKRAAEYTKPSGKTLLDLYCGAGTIGLSMAKEADSIIGVEIVPEAIADAELNAKANGIENARFICGDALAAAEKLAQDKVKSDVVIVDPPRKGCAKEVIDIICNRFKPERVVYVSCDPATLARDIKIFSEMGYSLTEYTPADLFPRTSHTECAALLERHNDINS